MENTTNIAQREMYTILISMRLWGHEMYGCVVKFYTDNQNSMFAINRGNTKDRFMLYCLREIVKITAKYQILLRSRFVESKKNLLPDALSRWYMTSEVRRIFKRNTDRTWRRRLVGEIITKVNL